MNAKDPVPDTPPAPASAADEPLQRLRAWPGTGMLVDAVESGDVQALIDASQRMMFRGFLLFVSPLLLLQAWFAIGKQLYLLAGIVTGVIAMQAVATLRAWNRRELGPREGRINAGIGFVALVVLSVVVLESGRLEYLPWCVLYIPIAFSFLGFRDGAASSAIYGTTLATMAVFAPSFGLHAVPADHLVEMVMLFATLFFTFGLTQLTREAFEQSALLLSRRLERLSVSDPLTGLYNRRRIVSDIDQRLSLAHRGARLFCIALIDLDHFKAINDTHGHQAGDAALVTFAELLQQQVRAADIVGRWGGEEFVVIFPDAGPEVARSIAERLRSLTAGTDYPHGEPVTASIGLAVCRADDTRDGLLERADRALYQAKERGRDRVYTDFGED